MCAAAKKPYYRDSVLLQKGRQIWVEGNYSQALGLFERAVKKEPFNLMALKDAAFAFGQHYEVRTARQYLQRFEKLVGKDPGALHLLAEAWQNAHQSGDAKGTLEKAIKSGSAIPESLLLLATWEEKRNKLGESAELVDRFLKARPSDPEGLLLKAVLLRRQGEGGAAKVLYHELAEGPASNSRTVKAKALNEWAQILDREGDYQGAVEKIILSKKFLQQHPQVQSLRAKELYEREWFDRFLATLDQEHFRQWAAESELDHTRHVILTGCPRSGTTLIEKVLDAHTEIVTAEEMNALSVFVAPKLLGDFSEDSFSADNLTSVPRSLLRREAKNYRRFLEGGMGEKIAGRILIDKIPSNTTMIPFLRRLMPASKVLYALRDPRDIVISSYFCWMELNAVSVNFHSVEATVERTKAELNWWLKLRERLPAESWMETRYEDTVSDLPSESKRIFEWLDLTSEEAASNYRGQLARKGVSSPSYESVNKPVYKTAIRRWENYQDLLAPFSDELQALAERLR